MSNSCSHDTVQAEEGAAPPSALQRVEDFIVGLLGLLAVLVCLYNVVLRNTSSSHAITASDEIQVYLIVWAVFLSLGVITSQGRHIKADLVLNYLGSNLKQKAFLFTYLLGLLFSMLMSYLGVQITLEAYEFGDVSSTSLRFPLWIYTAALPVGMSLMSLRYLLLFFRCLRAESGQEQRT